MSGFVTFVQPKARTLLAVAFLMSGAMASAQSLTITTLAGQVGATGSADGTGASARFSSRISDMVVDPAGNLYLLDANNYTIRKVTAAGVVTTIAGAAEVKEYRDGTSSGAHFYQPRGLARDSAGNLYVGDWNLAGSGPTVRKITPTGEVTSYLPAVGAVALTMDVNDYLLVGGSPIRVFLAGSIAEVGPWWVPPADAPSPPPVGNFGTITAFTVGRDRTIYVVDAIKNEVRKITTAGAMTSLAGTAGVPGYADGTGANARFNFPDGIAVDSTGNVYVADGNNPVLRKIAAGGVVTTVAGLVGAPPGGPFPDGVGSNARFIGLSALAIGSDDAVYIADFGAIRKATVATTPAKIVVSPEDVIVAAGERATFSVAANGYPATTFQWQRVSASGGNWTNLSDSATYAGTASAVLVINVVAGSMNGDRFRCVVSNTLATDTSAVATLTVDPPIVVVPLRVTTLAGKASVSGATDGTGTNARFNVPTAVANDAMGNVYVSEMAGNRIRKITPGGVVTTLAGSGVAGLQDGVGLAAQFRQPGPIAVDAQGNVFVADQVNIPDFATLPVIRKITPGGVVTTFTRGSTNGPRFNFVGGMAFDRAGNLVVSCSSEGLLRFTPAGTVTLPPLSGGQPMPESGGIAFDATGNLYIATAGVIYKVPPTGSPLTIVAGKSGVYGAVDGRAAIARFSGGSHSISVDGFGNLYVVEAANQVIRKVTPAGIVSTVAGVKPTANVANPTGATDGIGAAVRFNAPLGIAADRAGNIYVADSSNHTIRKANSVDFVAEGEAVEFYAQLADGGQPTGRSLSSDASIAVVGAPHRAALAAGSAYQWFKDSVAIAGATDTQLRIGAAAMADGGRYAVQVTTIDGALMSEPIALTVAGSRLANLSILSTTGTGAQALIVGFVVRGSGLPVLARGIGPSLAQFGVGAPLADPQLELYAETTLMTGNDNWGNSPDIGATAARVGAFTLAGASLDAALLTTLDNGAYSAKCSGANDSTGFALVELYDAGVAPTCRLVNVSARSQVTANDGPMTAGFAITGSSPRRVLIRGVGPTLTVFGVSTPLPDPQLRLYDRNNVLKAQNDNWSDNANAAEIAVASPAVGAFALSAGSKDAVLLLSLAPGTYTAQLSDVDSIAGIGLIEVYEVP